MGPDEARMGRVVFGSTGSMQHHPDVGAGEKHEKRTQEGAQRRMQHDITGSRAWLKERAELPRPCAARRRTRSRAAPGGRRTTWHDGGTSAPRQGMARCSGRPDRDSAPERPRAQPAAARRGTCARSGPRSNRSPRPSADRSLLIEWETDLAAVVADRYERVDVDDVTGAPLGGDVDRRRPGDGTIDNVALTDADGLEEDRDRGRGRHRATDVDVRELARPEDEALRRIDVHSGHIERARERGEAMRVSERREASAERPLEGLGRVEAGGVMGLEIRQHRGERCPAPSADGAADRAEERPGKPCEELDHASGGGAEDVLGPEVEGRVEVVAQGPEHLRGLGSVGDEGGRHRAGARPDEEVEMLVERSRRERFLEGREDTDLVEDADDAAAGENEGPPFALRGLHGGMLTGDHGWSPPLATERRPES